MESERERTRARHGSRLWAALVLVHDGANPNREWNHRRLPSAPVDLVVWTHWGAEPFSWNACGVAAPRRDAPRISGRRPERAAGLGEWGLRRGDRGFRPRGAGWSAVFTDLLRRASLADGRAPR